MARTKKQQQEENVQSAEPIIMDSTSEAAFSTELIEQPDNTMPVSIQAQTAPAAGVLKPQGVYLKSKKTSRVISGPISLKLAQAQAKAYPNLVEIVESI